MHYSSLKMHNIKYILSILFQLFILVILAWIYCLIQLKNTICNKNKSLSEIKVHRVQSMHFFPPDREYIDLTSFALDKSLLVNIHILCTIYVIGLPEYFFPIFSLKLESEENLILIILVSFSEIQQPIATIFQSFGIPKNSYILLLEIIYHFYCTCQIKYYLLKISKISEYIVPILFLPIYTPYSFPLCWC